MKQFISSGIRYDGEFVSVLDQQLLPHKEEWVVCKDLDQMVAAIKALKVRGAPAIGVAAALFVGGEATRGMEREHLLQMTGELRLSRPTAVNLMNYMDRLDASLKEEATDWKELLIKEVEMVFEEDVELCERIATHGISVIPDKEKLNILTHCNTGALATAGRGTALGIITKANEEGKDLHVWVDETRPLLQGGRLTAWELVKAGVSHAIVTDSMAGMVMASGGVDCVIVGADRIAMNGDFANKIGTYSLAVLCKHHQIPFYVAAPETTIDQNCKEGAAIPIEEREAEEVKGFSGALGSISWAPEQSSTYNPAFDVTPASLVTGWIFDSGVKRLSDWS